MSAHGPTPDPTQPLTGAPYQPGPQQPGAPQQPGGYAPQPGAPHHQPGGYAPQDQPGYPSQPGPPGPTGPGSTPIASAPPRSNPVPKIIAAVVGLGLVIITIIGLVHVFNGDASWVKAGDCVQIQQTSGKKRGLTHKGVDCNAKPGSSVTYQVATVNQPTCPNENYESYTEVNDSGKETHSACMIPMLTAGQCYAQPAGAPLQPVACTDPTAVVKIAKSIGLADESQCDAGDQAASFPEPAPGRTYCLAPPS